MFLDARFLFVKFISLKYSLCLTTKVIYVNKRLYLWPRCLRRRSVAARLLKSWVRIPPGAWIFVCCECRVLSSRGLCDELFTRPEESYRLWCVVVCDLETSRMGAPYIYDISSLMVNSFNKSSYWDAESFSYSRILPFRNLQPVHLLIPKNPLHTLRIKSFRTHF